jgi:hypothetical protein
MNQIHNRLITFCYVCMYRLFVFLLGAIQTESKNRSDVGSRDYQTALYYGCYLY